MLKLLEDIMQTNGKPSHNMETLIQEGLDANLIQKRLCATIVLKGDMSRQNLKDDCWWAMT